MSLKVVHLHKRLVQCHRKTLRKRGTHEQGSKKTWTTSKSNCCDIGSLNTGTCNCFTYNRYDIELMSS